MSSDPYVLTLRPTPGGDLDLSSLRGCAIADAHVRFRRMAGDDVLFAADPGAAAAGGPVDALGIGFDRERLPAPGDATVERWAQWLLERLDAAGQLYQRQGEGWRLRSGKPHGESERRLGELTGWTDAALDEQRKLLEHVDDPGDSGSDLEQSLSKLAAAGWKVDAKKDKGPPTVHFAAGDMPLARGDDWRAADAGDPRLAAALALLVAALPAGEREAAAPGDQAAEVVRRLPALAVVAAGTGPALLDLRTVAKALRDVGGLDLPSGEPLGTVLVHGSFRPRAASNGAAPAVAPAAAGDPAALIAAHGPDAVRFALLHAAAPGKPFAGGADVFGYAAAFLAELRELAAARLSGDVAAGTRIDPRDGLRRRLAGWCDTAVARTGENYERLDMHRATRNVVELLARIRDFDARVAEQRGEVAGADLEAIAVALALLAQLLAPLAPTAAGELWQRAGRDGSPGETPWPAAQREPATA